jgi:hypothetical protein
MRTDMFPVYAATLILNPRNYTRYIETYWLKKWSKPVLAKVKKLWERYRERAIIIPTSLAFSYNSLSYKRLELDVYDHIALSLIARAWPASQDKFEDYNSLESYDPGKKGALAWWCQDI